VAQNVVIGTAPDSWGIWFPDDPKQTPADRFLDEVVEAGYEWIEIGSFGYLPTDSAQLQDALGRRNLKVSGGTTFARLQHPGRIDEVWAQVAPIAALTAAMGAKDLVVIPDLWRDDLTGNEKESRRLTEEQWTALTENHDELGRRLLEEYGVRNQFHSHADSHIGYQPDVERFLEATNPEYVNLCLDTGHIAYFGGDSVELITKYPERIGYLHLKQVDAELAGRAGGGHLVLSGGPRRRHGRAALRRPGPRRGPAYRRPAAAGPVRDRRAGHVPPARPRRTDADCSAHLHLPVRLPVTSGVRL
jgi:inosose dehydratase